MKIIRTAKISEERYFLRKKNKDYKTEIDIIATLSSNNELELILYYSLWEEKKIIERERKKIYYLLPDNQTSIECILSARYFSSDFKEKMKKFKKFKVKYLIINSDEKYNTSFSTSVDEIKKIFTF